MSHFIQVHCIDQRWDRQEYLALDPSDLYCIYWDLTGIGVVVTPADDRPLLVSSAQLGDLKALEAVSTLGRLMFLQELEKAELWPERYVLIRADVLNEAAALEEIEEQFRDEPPDSELFDAMNAFRQERRRIHDFIRAKWSPAIQRAMRHSLVEPGGAKGE